MVLITADAGHNVFLLCGIGHAQKTMSNCTISVLENRDTSNRSQNQTREYFVNDFSVFRK